MFLACALCSCGGGGDALVGGPITDAKVTITWPERTRDPIPAPNSAQSATITIQNGAVGGGDVVVFITREDNVGLHYGEYPIGQKLERQPTHFTGVFFSDAHQGGVIVAEATGRVDIVGNTAVFSHITLANTVKSVQVISPTTFQQSNTPSQLLFEADAGNNTVVAVSPGSAHWQLVSGSGATLTPDGMFTPSTAGTYSVKVTVDGIVSPEKTLTVGGSGAQVTFEDLTDPSVYGGIGNAASGNGILGGQISLPNTYFNPYAAIWMNGQMQIVHPQGANSSEVLGMNGPTGVGWFSSTGSDFQATIFSGGAVTSLDPTHYSTANATDGITQVGQRIRKACLWQGTPASFVDLHPTAWKESYATGISNGDISGWLSNVPSGSTKAVKWTGSNHTMVDLDPAGFWGSKAFAISGNTVGGIYIVDGTGRRHACIWHGTPESLVDLNPSFAGGSSVNSLLNDVAVGFYVDQIVVTESRACIWNGSAAKFIDLDAILSSEYYSGSEAKSVAPEPGGYQVVGSAYRKTGFPGQRVIVWHVPASMLN